MEASEKKDVVQILNDQNAKEVVSLREDVTYLTKEASTLLDDLQMEQKARKQAEEKAQRAEQLRNSQAIHNDEKQWRITELEKSEETLRGELREVHGMMLEVKQEKQDLQSRFNLDIWHHLLQWVLAHLPRA